MSNHVMNETLLDTVCHTLEDMKALDVRVLDVHELTTITDHMVVASGTSSRHVRAMADRLREAIEERGHRILGMEGEQGAEWILLDLGEVVVHVFQVEVRPFYAIERLWDMAETPT
jgi:ribosome-associated protein